jgi:LAGLIDADG endonuclease
LRILVGQHFRDRLLISNIVNLLDCGYISKNVKRNFIEFKIVKFEDIYYKIIPMFNLYKIKGEKSKDFECFCEAANIIKNKDHLTLEGLNKIQKIKSKMNKARYNNYKF